MVVAAPKVAKSALAGTATKGRYETLLFKTKKIEKKIRHWLGRGTFKILSKTINFIPNSILDYLSDKLGNLAYFILWKFRQSILENLNRAFGKKKTSKEIEKIAKIVATNLFREFFVLIKSINFSSELWKERITIEGKENLDHALSLGRGVIGLSAHLGNFAILGGRLANEGYNLKTIIKDPTDPGMAAIFKDIRDRQGQKSIPAEPVKVCLRETLMSLRRNEIVLFVADENRSPRRGGIFVDFFGSPAATVTGPAVLTLRTNAPIVPLFIIRQQNGRYKIRIDPAIDLERSGNNKEDIISFTAKFTKIIETYVSQYPDQWMWINERWRSQPGDNNQKERLIAS